MKWEGHVARMAQVGNSYISARKRERKISALRKPNREKIILKWILKDEVCRPELD
jgi:hypothetical protein